MRGPDLVLWHLLRHGLRCWVLVRMGLAVAFVATMNPPLAAGGLVGPGVAQHAAMRPHMLICSEYLGKTLRPGP